MEKHFPEASRTRNFLTPIFNTFFDTPKKSNCQDKFSVKVDKKCVKKFRIKKLH